MTTQITSKVSRGSVYPLSSEKQSSHYASLPTSANQEIFKKVTV